MSDLNLCVFIGRLGADPEVRVMPSGKPVANIRIAVSNQWKDKQSGQKQEQTTWVPVVMFDGLADIASRFLKKGSRIRITGEFRVRQWQDQQGSTRYTTEIVASEMQMLDGRGDGQGNGGGHPAASQGAQGQANTNARSQGQSAAHDSGGFPAPGEDFGDEDIPF